MRDNDLFQYPVMCFIVSLIEINRSYQGLQCITEDLAGLEGIIELVIKGEFTQAHLEGDIIQLLAVNHFAAHLRQETFAFIGVSFEKIISHNRAEYRIAK